jgi:hypothetical protein
VIVLRITFLFVLISVSAALVAGPRDRHKSRCENVAASLAVNKILTGDYPSAQEKIRALRSAVTPKTQSGERFVRVYRGLATPLEDFDPIAKEYRKNEYDVWVSAHPGTISFGIDYQDGVARGLLLELYVPISMFQSHSKLDIRRIPSKDLAPYITRVGIVYNELDLADGDNPADTRKGTYKEEQELKSRALKNDPEVFRWTRIRRTPNSVMSEREFDLFRDWTN